MHNKCCYFLGNLLFVLFYGKVRIAVFYDIASGVFYKKVGIIVFYDTPLVVFYCSKLFYL